MRKTFLTFVGLLLAMIANAYTCVTFNSGDPSILLKEANITYEIDWDHARVTNHDNLLWQDYLRKRGNDFVKDWPKDREKAEKYFTVRFNKKSDYLQIKDKSPVYKMIVRPKTIDVGDGGSSFNPWASSKAGGCIINGTIDFCDAATGKVLCVLNIVEGKGTGYPSETIRIGLALSEIAGDIWDFVDDEVEEGKVQGTAVSGQPTTAVAVAEEKPATVAAQAVVAAPVVAATAATTAKPQAKQTAKAATQAKGKTKTQSKAQPKAEASANPATAATTSNEAGGEARVVMKNGSVLTGRVKAFDPTTSITMTVAGITTTIPMSEVSKVESLSGSSAATTTATTTAAPVATTTTKAATAATKAAPAASKATGANAGNYAAAINVSVKGRQIKMILIPGGRFKMGYDGDGSRKMKSEPVHDVVLTPYFISENPLPASLVIELIGNRSVEGKGNEPAQVRDFDDVEKLIQKVASQTGRPFRLPTEAEWECAACGEKQGQVFSIANGNDIAYEWCSDFHDDFADDGEVRTDPTGPYDGDQHVVRSYNCERGKHDRSNKVDEDDAYVGLVRLVIKAKDIQ